MSLLFPLGMAALGALVPLVALYLLKQKRIEQKVPTNFLWARAVEDLRASSLFQRLRATLLLLLQAAAVLLFALAAAGATLDLAAGGAPRHVIVLLDRSASMRATDEKDGASRFDAARAVALRAVESLSSADEMMIVAFDRRAEVLQSFTGDRERLAEVLRAASPRDLPTRLADTLSLAVSFAQASKGFDSEILLLTDGAVEEPLPQVACPLTYVKMGRAGENQGVAEVALSRTPGEPVSVFVRVENGHGAPVRRNVSLTRRGAVVDARAVDVPALGGATAFFTLTDDEAKETEILTVALEGKDALATDDSVQFVLRPSVPRNGLIVSAEPTLWLDPVKTSRLHPGLGLTLVSLADATAAVARTDPPIDFVCYVGAAPAALPDVAAQMYVDCLPPTSGLSAGPKLPYPIVVDWDRTHPTTSRCQFDDLLVLESTKLLGADRSRVLIDSTGGPLALLTPVPGREVVVLGFSPGASNFPLKLSWPLFLANTLDFLLSRTERDGEEPVSRTGEPLTFAAAAPLTVTTPSGGTRTIEPDARRRAIDPATHERGIYSAAPASGGGAAELRARALLSSAETRIAPRSELVVGGAKVAAKEGSTQRNVLLRDPLLVAALGLLVLEWALWCSRR